MLRSHVCLLLALTLGAVSAYDITGVTKVELNVTVTGLPSSLYPSNYEKVVTIVAGERNFVNLKSIPFGPTTVTVKYFQTIASVETMTFYGQTTHPRDGTADSHGIDILMLDQDPPNPVAINEGCKAIQSSVLTPYRLEKNSTNQLKITLVGGDTFASKSQISVLDHAGNATYVTIDDPGENGCPNVPGTFCITPSMLATAGNNGKLSIDADVKAVCGVYGDLPEQTIDVLPARIAFSVNIETDDEPVIDSIALGGSSTSYYVKDSTPSNALSVDITMDKACSTADSTTITATRHCTYNVASSADAVVGVAPASDTVSCLDGNTTVTMTHDFPATIGGSAVAADILTGICTVTYTVKHGGTAGRQDPSTLKYFIGPGSGLTSSPDTEFAFVSRLHYQTSAPLGGDNDASSALLLSGVTDPADKFAMYAEFSAQGGGKVSGIWACSESYVSIESPVTVDGNSTISSTVITDGNTFQATADVSYDSATDNARATAECWIEVYNPDNPSDTTRQTFYLHKEVVTYSPTPAPTPVCAPPPSCTQHQVAEVSTPQHLYIGNDPDPFAFVPDAIVGIHTQDASIFKPSLDIDVTHAVANCAEIEAKIQAVTTDGNGEIFHLSVKELYYQGDWHVVNTQLLVDKNNLQDTHVRVISTPHVPTGDALQLVNCDSGQVLMTLAVMQYHPQDLAVATNCSVNEYGDNERKDLISLSGQCHVILLMHNNDVCDTMDPLVLYCDTTCQQHDDTHYLRASASGTITVYEDAQCSTVSPGTGPLYATGISATSATSSIPDITHYSSQLYSA